MLKHKILSTSALVMALFASYSCQENDFYIFPEPSDSELTSLEVMQKDPDCANFLKVADACGCLDSLFSDMKSYTIFVPTQESVNVDSLLQCVENGDREEVYKDFITYHVANHLHAANGTLDSDNKILMLNAKYAVFTGDTENGYTFDGKRCEEVNIRTKNAIIHKIASPADYNPSIWEWLKRIDAVSSFWNFCNSFTEKKFSASSSVLGPIVNQEQTYLDSVFVETNSLLRDGSSLLGDALGYVDNEDSLFLFFAPTTDLWNTISEKAKTYYRYNTDGFNEEEIYEADSLTNVVGPKYYLRYLTYSMNDQVFPDGVVDFDNLPDSLLAAFDASWKSNSERKKVAVSDLSYIERVTASNGEIRIIDNMPFTPIDLWFDTIRVQAEGYSYVRKDEYDVYQEKGIATDVTVNEKDQNPAYEGEVSSDSYVMCSKESSTLPSRTYFIPNILSAKYRIAFVTIPFDIVDSTAVKKYPSSLGVTVTYGGETLFANAEVPEKKTGTCYLNTIRPEMAAIDTIYLSDKETGEPIVFEFEYCEKFSGFSKKTFDDSDYTVEVKFESLPPAEYNERNSKYKAGSYEQSFTLDFIMFVPVDDEEDTETDSSDE